MNEKKAMPFCGVKVKICGITTMEEAGFLNEAGADYAGFVFYEKSRRNIRLSEAKDIAKTLTEGILKAAVTVSPDLDFVREIEALGFDLLQVHGTLTQDVREHARIPIWRAVNITDEKKLEYFFEEERAAGMEYISGYVADGAGYGGGKPFDWEGLSKSVRVSLDAIRQSRSNTLRVSLDAIRQNRSKQLILAGGLTEENVTQGIRCFEPDIVDVSSGVEENGKKSRIKIENFIRKVRQHG